MCSKTPWHGSSMVTTPAGCDFGEDSEVPDDEGVVLYHSVSMVDFINFDMKNFCPNGEDSEAP